MVCLLCCHSRMKQKENDVMRKRKVVNSLYYYSDLSVRNIARQVDLSIPRSKGDDKQPDKEWYHSSMLRTSVDKIMSGDVACLDHSRTASDAASLMTTRKVGSVIVTVKNRLVWLSGWRIGRRYIYFHDVFKTLPLIHLSPLKYKLLWKLHKLW